MFIDSRAGCVTAALMQESENSAAPDLYTAGRQRLKGVEGRQRVSCFQKDVFAKFIKNGYN